MCKCQEHTLAQNHKHELWPQMCGKHMGQHMEARPVCEQAQSLCAYEHAHVLITPMCVHTRVLVWGYSTDDPWADQLCPSQEDLRIHQHPQSLEGSLAWALQCV